MCRVLVWCLGRRGRTCYAPCGVHPRCTWGVPHVHMGHPICRWGKCCEHDLFPMWQHTPCAPHFRIAPSAYFFLFMMFSSGKWGVSVHTPFAPHGSWGKRVGRRTRKPKERRRREKSRWGEDFPPSGADGVPHVQMGCPMCRWGAPSGRWGKRCEHVRFSPCARTPPSAELLASPHLAHGVNLM